MYFNLRRKKKVLEQVGCGIQQVKSLVTYVSDTFNKQISCSTLKRLLREADYIWKRMKHSLKDKRNELDFRYFQEELQRLRALELQGEIDLFYFDETGINLTPSIPYAWIPKGVRSLLPCTKSKNINILGFMNQDNKLYSYAFEGAATSEVVIKCMDDFCDQITKKTVVVLDNAAIHKSNAVKSKMSELGTRCMLFAQLIGMSLIRAVPVAGRGDMALVNDIIKNKGLIRIAHVSIYS